MIQVVIVCSDKLKEVVQSCQMLRRSVRTVCQAVITGKSLPPCYYSVRKVTE